MANEPDSLAKKSKVWGNIKSTHILYNRNINPYVYYPKIANQSYAEFFLQKEKITMGVRLERYQEAMVGMPDEMNKWGLASKFVQYKNKNIDIGLGNHYDQFGNGLIFKTQEQRAIGMDNSLDGFWGNFQIGNFSIKSTTGHQRIGFKHAKGWLSGLDMELKKQYDNKSFSVGLSNILKIEDNQTNIRNIDRQVWANAFRAEMKSENLSITIEAASKSPDPNENNLYSSKRGQAFVGIIEWSELKNSVVLQIKGIENFDFRSERGRKLNTASVNYIPNFTKLNTYRLLTLYPYASQVAGEIGGQVEWSFFAENGAEITTNMSYYAEPRQSENPNSLYKELSFEYIKYLSENTKLNVLANYAYFNKGVILGGLPEIVKYQAIVADLTFKANKHISINTQAQHLYTKQDKGSWLMALTNVTINSKYSIFLSDEYNYKPNQHYYQTGGSLNLGSKTLGISYGKVRAGLLCIGGVCQIIPEYEGLSVNFGLNF